MPIGNASGPFPGQHPSNKSKPRVEDTRPKLATKLSYKDQRDFELLPDTIAEIETGITRDEAALSDASLYARDPARFAALTKAIEAARAEKDAAEERWFALAEQVEALK